MRGLSLRARLLLVLALALAPAVALATMRVAKGLIETDASQAAAVSAVAEVAVSRHRNVIDGARRLALSLSEGRFLASWAEGREEPSDYATECHVRLERIRSRFAQEFAAVALIDESGVVRCANEAAVRGASMRGAEVFEQAKERRDFVVGKYAKTPLSPASVIPAGVPIVRDGRFRGVVVVGISLEWFVDVGAARNTPMPLHLAVVDESGAPAIAAAAADDRTLPPRPTLAKAIGDRRMAFRERSAAGELYDYHVAPFSAGSLLAVVAVPASAQPGGLTGLWVELGAVFLTSALALFALWTAADMWCLRPLKPVRAAAAAIARGDYGLPRPAKVSTPEMQALSDDVFAIAESMRRREDELKAGLKQREQMLREIHHRVKNNLQMISSLLSLQADTIRSPRIRRFFRAAQNRVLTLSILHRHLYERSNWSSVDFQAFISDLVRHLSAEQSRAGSLVRFDVKAPVMEVGPDSAIPAGLIVTEAVSNALNHAFAGVDAPEVRITAVQDGSEVELTIEDNGVGIADIDANLEDRPGLGFTLLRGLSAQLGGQADIAAREGGGTVVKVRFPSPELSDENTVTSKS